MSINEIVSCPEFINIHNGFFLAALLKCLTLSISGWWNSIFGYIYLWKKWNHLNLHSCNRVKRNKITAFQRKNGIKYSLRQTSEEHIKERGCLATLIGKVWGVKKKTRPSKELAKLQKHSRHSNQCSGSSFTSLGVAKWFFFFSSIVNWKDEIFKVLIDLLIV